MYSALTDLIQLIFKAALGLPLASVQFVGTEMQPVPIT